MGNKPGRKPMGKVAMSDAERMRKYRERQRDNVEHLRNTKPQTTTANELAGRLREAEQEIENLQDEIISLRRLAKSGGVHVPIRKWEREGLPRAKLKPYTAKQCAELVASPKLAKIIATIEEEGKKNVATISPTDVTAAAYRLRQLIDEIAQRVE